ARSLAIGSGSDTERSGQLGPEKRITTQPGPDINPVACTDQTGRPWLACQSWIEGQGRISVFRLDDRGAWAQQAVVEGAKGENCWNPAIAADNTGKVAVAYDRYHGGDYDVHVAVFDGASGKHHDFPVATSPKSKCGRALPTRGSGCGSPTRRDPRSGAR